MSQIDLGPTPIENGTYRYRNGNYVVVKNNRFVFIYYANDDRIRLTTLDNGEYKVVKINTHDGVVEQIPILNLSKIYSLIRCNSSVGVTDDVMLHFNKLISNNNFDEIELTLKLFDCNKLNPSIITGLITLLKPMKDNLHNCYEGFFFNGISALKNKFNYSKLEMSQFLFRIL